MKGKQEGYAAGMFLMAKQQLWRVAPQISSHLSSSSGGGGWLGELRLLDMNPARMLDMQLRLQQMHLLICSSVVSQTLSL
jgi:hypothetical protein